MALTIFDTALVYYLWVFAVAMATTAVFILFGLSSEKKGMLSKISKFLMIGTLFWILSVIVHAIRHSALDLGQLLSVSLFFAGSVLVTRFAHYQMKIMGILKVKRKKVHPLIPKVTIAAIFLITVFGIIHSFLGLGFLHAMFEDMSLITDISLLLIAVSLLPHMFPKKFKKVPKFFAAIPLIIGVISLIGHYFDIPLFHTLVQGAVMSTPTAGAVILLSISLLLFSYTKGIEWNMTVWVFLFVVLYLGLFALVGYFFNIPLLYSDASLARLSVPTAITLVLMAFAMNPHVIKYK